MKRILSLLLTTVVLASVARAQPPGVLPNSPTYGVSLQGSALSSSGSQLDEGGEVDVSRWSMDVGYKLPLPGDIKTTISYGYEKRVYDASGSALFESLPEDAQVDSIDASLFGVINESWMWMATPAFQWSTMGDADNNGDSFNFRGLGLALWEQREGLTWSFGALFRTQLEESGMIVPIVGVNWAITDRLTLRTSDEVALNYAFDGKRRWSTEISVVPRQWEYRIEEGDEPTSEGVFRDQRWMIWGSVRYQPNPGMSLRGIVGTSFNERYTTYDKSGDRIEGDSGDGPLHAGIEFTIKL